MIDNIAKGRSLIREKKRRLERQFEIREADRVKERKRDERKGCRTSGEKI